MAWLSRSKLSEYQIDNIKQELTIYPRKTTDIQTKEDPAPIFLFEEDEERDWIGIPRYYYQKRKAGDNEEILDVSYGRPIRDVSTKFRAFGPYVEQEEAISELQVALQAGKWGGVILKAAPGFGKALAHGEPVLTPNGYVPIEDLSVGDLVAGTDGNFHPVTGVYPQGEKHLFRVEFTDGSYVDCDGDHLWTFEKRRSDGNQFETLSARDLACRDLTSECNCKYSHKLYWLPDIEPVVFDDVDLPMDAYTLGVLLGDGGISGRCVFVTSMDQGIIGNLRFPPGNVCNLCKGSNSGKANIYRVSVPRDMVADDRFISVGSVLSNLGLLGCTSHDKFIPEIYERSSVGDRINLLQGLFDADGSAISSGLVEYATVSRMLVDSVRNIVCSLGGTCVVAERDTRYTKDDGLKSEFFHSYRLTVKLPRWIKPFRLRRKASVVESASWQRRLGRAVKSIKPAGRGLATCISVDSPDRLFLTRNCIPTHNTITSLELARRVGRKTLVLVHKDFLVRQWKKRINWLMPDARVGIIKQKICEFDELQANGEEPDFVIALLQSLSRDDGFKYSDKLYSAFGTIVADECHRVAANSWSSVMPRFNAAWRIGISATPKRKDGAQDVFFHHISPITYSATTRMMRPKLRRIYTTSNLRPISRGNYQVSISNLNSAQVLNQLAADKFRTNQIVDDVVKGVIAGRKILVVSERLGHLKAMAERLGSVLFDKDLSFIPRLDFYTGQWFTNEKWTTTKRGKNGNILHRKGDYKLKTRTPQELERAESANVLFATKQIIEEAFDLPPIDVLVMATPMSDIEQMVGRCQRWCFPDEEKCKALCPWRAGQCKEKKQPIVVDVVDELIVQLNSKYQRRLRFYQKIGAL